MDIILLNTYEDKELILFLKKHVSKKVRKLFGVKLGFFKRGPYTLYKDAYPTLIKYYLEWLSNPNADVYLDIREE